MSSVKLIALTAPRVEGINTAEEFICYCARISNPSNQMNNLTSPKLMKYLIDNKHWSPFEKVSLTMDIQTTRDIGRQILRHRSFSFQEFSQRYADPTSMEFELREARLQDNKNRQNSIEIEDDIPIDWDGQPITEKWEFYQNNMITHAKAYYRWAIRNGIAKEQARAILPEGLTSTRMYMSGTLRSWIHYCLLRMKNGTQKEHMIIAEQCWKEILKDFPSLENILTE